MLKLFGTVLVWGGCGLIGVHSAGLMRQRVRFLEEMERALEQLEHELLLKHSALPDLIDRLCGTCRRQTRELFLDCNTEIRKGNSFTYAWERALERAKLLEEDREVLGCLTQILGQYDAQEQSRGLSRLQEELRQRVADGREEARAMGRVYCVLGFAAGGFLSLTLL